MWSPVSMCGVKLALCLPLRRMAICVQRRPSTLSVASTTYQSPLTVSFFANTVDITRTLQPILGPPSSPLKNGPAEEFGRDLTGGPLQKGAQVYSRPPVFAKEEAPQNPCRPSGLGTARQGL